MIKKMVGDATCELCLTLGKTIVHTLNITCPHVQEVCQLTFFFLLDTLVHAPGNELWDVFDYLKNYLICAGPAAVGYDLVEYWLGSKSWVI